MLKQNSFNLRSLISACFPPYLKCFAFFGSNSRKNGKKTCFFNEKMEKITNMIRNSDMDQLIGARAKPNLFSIPDLHKTVSSLPGPSEFVLPLSVVSV